MTFIYTKVSDLSPLKGMPLTHLNCGSNPIADLSPLEGIQLTNLNFGSTKVSDLSPLRGMPLKDLGCYSNSVSLRLDFLLFRHGLQLRHFGRRGDVQVAGLPGATKSKTSDLTAMRHFEFRDESLGVAARGFAVLLTWGDECRQRNLLRYA